MESGEEITQSDINEAKYRFEKAFRMLHRDAKASTSGAILQGYKALGGDPDELIDETSLV